MTTWVTENPFKKRLRPRGHSEGLKWRLIGFGWCATHQISLGEWTHYNDAQTKVCG